MYSPIAHQKITQFTGDGHNKLHIVADFDRTLTKAVGTHVGATTWGLISQFLPPEGKEIQKKLYEKYRTLEFEGLMTPEDALCWWESSLQNYVHSRVSFDEIKNAIQATLKPRKGVQELFDIAQQHDIPIIIVSAGIKNIIEYWCDIYDFKPTLVLSTELRLSHDNHIIGWKKENLIHVLNKNKQSMQFTAPVREKRPNIILVGDSLDDSSMVSGDTQVLRILIDDLGDDEKQLRNETYVGKVKDRFDIHLISDTLQPVVDIIQTIIDH